ncbi:hypothetical protein [Arthrobacter sp. StoSoilA2]|uniref:hypothetical protein n=1 Tax=Arthrobacter sp. StoSoilA2 TaxID=2830990 RepID=UPI001CC473C1|nr:hypothetical protein [Arthrobacter sp. StoSoilA2]
MSTALGLLPCLKDGAENSSPHRTKIENVMKNMLTLRLAPVAVLLAALLARAAPAPAPTTPFSFPQDRLFIQSGVESNEWKTPNERIH